MKQMFDDAAKARKFVTELYENRYTAKYYDPEKVVSEEDFQTIIEAGRLAPSSMGWEPWHFVRLRNPELLAEITPIIWGGQNKIGVASHTVALLGRRAADLTEPSDYMQHISQDVQGLPEKYVQARYEKMRSFAAEDRDIKTERQIEDWIAKNVYIAMANMLTAAAILGIDSTPIEGFPQERLHQILAAKGVYDPEHFRVQALLTFGYTARDPRPKTRRPLSEVYTEF